MSLTPSSSLTYGGRSSFLGTGKKRIDTKIPGLTPMVHKEVPKGPRLPDWVTKRPFLTGHYVLMDEPRVEESQWDKYGEDTITRETTETFSALPVEAQDLVLVGDMVHVLIGVSGKYIKFAPASSLEEEMYGLTNRDSEDTLSGSSSEASKGANLPSPFIGAGSLFSAEAGGSTQGSGSPSLMSVAASSELEVRLEASAVVRVAHRDLLRRIVPLGLYYSFLDRFVYDRSLFHWGMCNHTFAAAVKQYLVDYLAFVSQLEQEMRDTQALTLQKMWFYSQPFLKALSTLYRVCSEANAASCKGGKLINLLLQHSRAFASDHETEEMFETLLRAACAPYLRMLHHWVHRGTISDPYHEFMVVQNESEDYTDSNIGPGMAWHRRFFLREDRNHIPSFIDEDTAEIVLKTGKYLNVMTQEQKLEQRWHKQQTEQNIADNRYRISRSTTETPAEGADYQKRMFDSYPFVDSEGNFAFISRPVDHHATAHKLSPWENYRQDREQGGVVTAAAGECAQGALAPGKSREKESTLETIEFRREARYYRMLSLRAFRFASSALRDYLMVQCKLRDHIGRMVRYFLMKQGHWVLDFAQTARRELSLEVSKGLTQRLRLLLQQLLPVEDAALLDCKLSRYTLLAQLSRVSMTGSSGTSSLLSRAAISSGILSSDQLEDTENGEEQQEETDKGAKVRGPSTSRSRPPSSKDTSTFAYESFALVYKVEWPLSMVINSDAQMKYQLLFRHFLQCKLTEQRVTEMWHQHQAFKRLRCAKRIVNGSFALRQRMVHFLRVLQWYMSTTVVEHQWCKLQRALGRDTSPTADDVISAHSDFLNTCTLYCLLEDQEVMLLLTKLLLVCNKHAEYLQKFGDFLEERQRDFRRANPALSRADTEMELAAQAVELLEEHKFSRVIQDIARAYDSRMGRLLDYLEQAPKGEGPNKLPKIVGQLVSQLDENCYFRTPF